MFSLQCESTVTINYSGSMTYSDNGTVLFVPFFVNLFLASSIDPSTAIIATNLSEQTVTVLNPSYSNALNLNATVILPPGSYTTRVQFASQLTLVPAQSPVLHTNGVMSAICIKTRK